jgi:hypothetical protein
MDIDLSNTTQTLEAYVRGPASRVHNKLQKYLKRFDLPLIHQDQNGALWDDGINQVKTVLVEGDGNKSRWHIYCTGTWNARIPEPME